MNKFNVTPTFKLNGKLGGSIIKELNLSLEATDTMSLKIDLGEIHKSEVCIHFSVSNMFLSFFYPLFLLCGCYLYIS